MGKNDWNTVTREDVIKAIHMFTNDNPEYPEPKSTFLLFEGKKLPAKHIRGMAYKEAHGIEISKNKYAGGMETVRFFRKLGFDVFYNGEILYGNSRQPVSNGSLPENPSYESLKNIPFKNPSKTGQKDTILIKETDEKAEKIKISSKGVIEQKNALQLILNRYFDCDIVCEKTFPWLKTPDEINDEYRPIYDGLKQLQGDTSFAKRNVVLRCDFVCESRKVIIEYDERQHFSQARYVSLSAYPKDIMLGYEKELWMRACKDIQAKDNFPENRDAIRAFYDSVRDIECAKHGYRLVRIMHGQFDWNSENAECQIKKLLHVNPMYKKEMGKNKGMKIGLYLQTQTACSPEAFQRAMDIASNADFDILVFPEDCYCPEIEELWQLDIAQEDDVEKIRKYCLNLSRQIKKAVVFSPFDKYCTPYSVFANYKADEKETEFAVYIKHTMAESSAFDFTDYKEIAMEIFSPIIYREYKIGMTICYDCNHALFSRMWGIKGVDIILNSTGGDVIYDKWYKYNKVRAIENHCYNFVTMGGAGTNDNAHTYVYGFNPEGGELPFYNLMVHTDKTNEINTIYVYDISLDNGKAQVENSLYQKEKANKHQDYFFPVEHMHTVLEQAEKIDTNLYILTCQENTLVFCMVEGLDIMQPEHSLKLLYSDKLKGYQNKRYILVNYHEKEIEQDFFETKLSVVLKVRAMENFCAVVLQSPNIKHCYQTGNNRTAQVIPVEDRYYGIDISRTSGPEAIWKNKQGMKSEWRKNFEWLIEQVHNSNTDS